MPTRIALLLLLTTLVATADEDAAQLRRQRERQARIHAERVEVVSFAIGEHVTFGGTHTYPQLELRLRARRAPAYITLRFYARSAKGRVFYSRRTYLGPQTGAVHLAVVRWKADWAKEHGHLATGRVEVCYGPGDDAIPMLVRSCGDAAADRWWTTEPTAPMEFLRGGKGSELERLALKRIKKTRWDGESERARRLRRQRHREAEAHAERFEITRFALGDNVTFGGSYPQLELVFRNRAPAPEYITIVWHGRSAKGRVFHARRTFAAPRPGVRHAIVAAYKQAWIEEHGALVTGHVSIAYGPGEDYIPMLTRDAGEAAPEGWWKTQPTGKLGFYRGRGQGLSNTLSRSRRRFWDDARDRAARGD